MADGFGAAILRDGVTTPLPPARRRAVTLRFARTAAHRCGAHSIRMEARPPVSLTRRGQSRPRLAGGRRDMACGKRREWLSQDGHRLISRPRAATGTGVAAVGALGESHEARLIRVSRSDENVGGAHRFSGASLQTGNSAARRSPSLGSFPTARSLYSLCFPASHLMGRRTGRRSTRVYPQPRQPDLSVALPALALHG